MAKWNILYKSATSMLAQANANPQLAADFTELSPELGPKIQISHYKNIKRMEKTI